MNPNPQQRRARESRRLALARRNGGPASSPTEGEPVDLHTSVAGEEDPGASIDQAELPAEPGHDPGRRD